MRTVQILLVRTNIENTVRHLGVAMDDALTVLKQTEILLRRPAAQPEAVCQCVSGWQVSVSRSELMNGGFVGVNRRHPDPRTRLG